MKRIVVSFCVSITAFVANFTCFALTDDTGGMSGEEMAVIDAINELRAQRGLSCLQPADHMLSGARQSANAQAHRRQCGHFVGLQGASGEICAQTSGGARHAAKMWLNSPDHRRIMLSTSAACISVGVVNGYYAARVGRGHSAKRANFQAATRYHAGDYQTTHLQLEEPRNTRLVPYADTDGKDAVLLVDEKPISSVCDEFGRPMNDDETEDCGLSGHSPLYQPSYAQQRVVPQVTAKERRFRPFQKAFRR